MNNFIHLKVKSEYCLLNSLLKIEDIVNFAKQNNANAIAIADDNSLSAGLKFSSALKKNNIKPIIGINILIKDLHFTYRLPLYAKNANGYKNLLMILYIINLNKKADCGIEVQLIKDYFKDILCLSGGLDGFLNKRFVSNYIDNIKDILTFYKNIFLNDFYIEISRYGLEKEKECEDFLLNLAEDLNIPIVATNDAYFLHEEDFQAYDAICCIREKDFLSNINRKKLNKNFSLKSPDQMIKLFSDIPEAIENTLIIAKKCSFIIEDSLPRLPNINRSNIPSEDILTQKAQEGLNELIQQNQKIYSIDVNIYQKRLEYELSIINKIGFAGYFLIVEDFVKWSKENKVAVGPGRGSGSASIIAWALKITEPDPIKYGLIFERFLNPERISMPDFDIDFCQENRHKVIDYIKNKYGHEYVSYIITYGKMNAKGVLKDVGRVMQIPYLKIDNISKMIPFNPLEQITIEKALKMDHHFAQEAQKDQEVQELINLSMTLEGLNRHHSKHAAGIIIADQKLHEICPIMKDEESDMSILAYDMKDAEKMGLLKFDFLGLKTLTVISKTIDLIYERHKLLIDFSAMEMDNKKTFQLIRSGKLKGVFQIEAAVPRNVLQQIQANCFNDIVVTTTLNRPGPMDSIPSFVKRKLNQEKPEYYEDCLKDILSESYGLIIYQEQVLQTAQKLAGYSLGEADLLRRAMGKKIKEEMDAQREVFVKKAENFGIIAKQKAEYMFDIIAKFAGYGFNKAHAVAYSFLSYQTAYLKANYSLEFFTTLLNLDIADTDKINILINDIKNFNIEILPPDINQSNTYFQIENGKIRYSLAALKAVGEENTKEIIKIRNEEGNFTSLEDLCKKCKKLLNKKNLESFIKSSTLSTFQIKKSTLIENVKEILDYIEQISSGNNDNQFSLFAEMTEINLTIKEAKIEYEEDILSAFEKEVFGFYFSKHPMASFKENLSNIKNILYSEDLEELNLEKNSNFMMFGVISKIIQRFKKNGRFMFIHLVDFDGNYEGMIFDEKLILQNSEILKEGNSILISVNIKNNSGTGNRILINNIYNIKEYFSNKTVKDIIAKEEDININKSNNESQIITINDTKIKIF